MLRWGFVATLLAVPMGASAQEVQYKPTAAYTRSMAAGYKALELCGAIFNAGRSQAQAEALEMSGIYPELDSVAHGLTAEVTRPVPGLGVVTVPFDPNLPPRRAVWLGDAGCTIQPLGAPIPARGGKTGFAGTMDKQNWPMGDANASAPTPAPLVAPLHRAFDASSYGKGRTTAVVIVRNGKIVGEDYAEGFDLHTSQRTFSAAKSMAGTLVGIAVRDKLLTPDQPAGFWKNDLRADITLDNLIRMGSGLHTDGPGGRLDTVYLGGTTVAQEGDYWLAEAKPGTRFRYSNLDILLAVRALRGALNDEARYAAYPKTELFAKLGMTRTVAERDVAGNYILSSQVWSTARDLARLGMFWLGDGVWNGQRILPAGWMKYMTTPSGPQPEKGPGYGATMWLFGPEQGLPAGSYAAQGNRGQVIMVVPSQKLVVVRRGEDAAGTGFDIAKFTADVIAALH